MSLRGGGLCRLASGKAPTPADVAAYACEHAAGALLLDTWQKDGTTLLDHLDPEAIGRIIEQCRAAEVKVALAGSLGLAQIQRLRSLGPGLVRGSKRVCQGGDRRATIQPERVGPWSII